MVFIEALLEPYVFLITAANDFCLLLFKQENLLAFFNNSLQGPFSVLAVHIFSYLEVLTRLCSSDEQSL